MDLRSAHIITIFVFWDAGEETVWHGFHAIDATEVAMNHGREEGLKDHRWEDGKC